MKGKRFGNLVVIKYHSGVNGNNHHKWICLCDCGNIKIMWENNLKRGKSKSCGCMRKYTNKHLQAIPQKHGHYIYNRPTSEYLTWQSIKTRCYNPKAGNYRYYGEMGVQVCDEWLNSFEQFYKDMGDRPSDKHSIDRINPWGDYEPSNCRWATHKEQANNKRRQRCATL